MALPGMEEDALARAEASAERAAVSFMVRALISVRDSESEVVREVTRVCVSESLSSAVSSCFLTRAASLASSFCAASSDLRVLMRRSAARGGEVSGWWGIGGRGKGGTFGLFVGLLLETVKVALGFADGDLFEVAVLLVEALEFLRHLAELAPQGWFAAAVGGGRVARPLGWAGGHAEVVGELPRREVFQMVFLLLDDLLLDDGFRLLRLGYL